MIYVFNGMWHSSDVGASFKYLWIYFNHGMLSKRKSPSVSVPPFFVWWGMFQLQRNYRRDVSCIDSPGLHNILPNVYSVLSDRLYHFASRRLGVFLLIGNDFSPSHCSCMLLPGKCHLLYLLQLCWITLCFEGSTLFFKTPKRILSGTVW